MWMPTHGIWNRRNRGQFSHRITLTTSGTIGSQSAANVSGVVATKTASKTGRYTLVVPGKYRNFSGGYVTMIGSTDASIGSKAVAHLFFFRNQNIDTGSGPFSIDLQCAANDGTNIVDAECATNTVLHVELTVER